MKHNHSHKPNAANPLARQLWAFRVGLLALAMQVFMPIGQGLAASTIGGNDGPGTNTFLLCTQYGIQLKTIAPDAAPDDVTEGRSTTKALWDCSICQLQMGVDTPKPQLFTFKIEIFEKYNVETAQDSIVAEIHITRPNPPRAPPAA